MVPIWTSGPSCCAPSSSCKRHLPTLRESAPLVSGITHRKSKMLRVRKQRNNLYPILKLQKFHRGFETVDPAAQIPSNQQSLRDDCSTIHATSSEHRDSCQPETYHSTSLGTLVTNKSFVSKPKATSNTESETTWNNQTYFKPIVIITNQDEIRWIHPWYCTWMHMISIQWSSLN